MLDKAHIPFIEEYENYLGIDQSELNEIHQMCLARKDDDIPLKKVLVIGGGVSGLMTAYIASEFGHEVTLVEKTDRLGGVLWIADVDPHKAWIPLFKENLVKKCRAAGTKICTNTEAGPELLHESDWDTVICAVGTVHSVPEIPGIQAGRSILDAYSEIGSIGNRVVIIEGSRAGCEAGIYLSELGRRVHILEPSESILKDANEIERLELVERMKMLLTWDCNAIVKDILPGSVRFLDDENEELLIAADTVLYATGMYPDEDMIEQLQRARPDLIRVGSCMHPTNIKEACLDALRAAIVI